MARGVIAQARAAGLIVDLSMQTEGLSCTPLQNGNLQKLPDVNTEQAWAPLLNSALTPALPQQECYRLWSLPHVKCYRTMAPHQILLGQELLPFEASDAPCALRPT